MRAIKCNNCCVEFGKFEKKRGKIRVHVTTVSHYYTYSVNINLGISFYFAYIRDRFICNILYYLFHALRLRISNVGARSSTIAILKCDHTGSGPEY